MRRENVTPLMMVEIVENKTDYPPVIQLMDQEPEAKKLSLNRDTGAAILELLNLRRSMIDKVVHSADRLSASSLYYLGQLKGDGSNDVYFGILRIMSGYNDDTQMRQYANFDLSIPGDRDCLKKIGAKFYLNQ